MEKLEMLWSYMQEDMKADKIAGDIKNSPLRHKLEKTRDYILAQQELYKKMEEQVAVSTDRKDAIRDAVSRCEEQLSALQTRFEQEPPETLEDTQKLFAEVERCRKTIAAYEAEMKRISKDSTEFDTKADAIRRGAAKAKQEFDQMKTQYAAESEAKKATFSQQRAAADKMVAGIPKELLDIYNQVKRQITPPMAKLYNGQCSGCNTSQPSAALRKIDAGSEIVECETCGRILIK